MTETYTNRFSQHWVWYSGTAPVKVLIRLDNGPAQEDYIAGYLRFWDKSQSKLPADSRSEATGYIIKNLSLGALQVILEMLQHELDIVKQPMAISYSEGSPPSTFLITRPRARADQFVANLLQEAPEKGKSKGRKKK
jgi:hypothetical protein